MGESQRRAEADQSNANFALREQSRVSLVKLRDAVLVAGKESRTLLAGERGAPRDATQPAGQCILHRVPGGIQVETLDGKDCLYIPDSNIVMVKYAPRAPSAA